MHKYLNRKDKFPQVYLAGGFFSPEQIKTINAVETMLDKYGHDYFSPRKAGKTIEHLSEEEKKLHAKEIFESNCINIMNANIMLACIDDRDAGTMWEIGYGYARFKGINIFTFSAHNHGSNIMVSQCVKEHFPSLELVDKFLAS